MKKRFCALAFISLLLSCYSDAQGVLVITQYYEGASSDKWIEVTNVGNTALDLTSPQLYLCLYSNTSADNPSGLAPTSNETLSGTINPGGVLLFQNSSAALPSYASGTSSSVINFNGDDVVIISTSNSTSAWEDRLDVVGDGTSWGTNTSFSRNTSAISPSTTFTVGDWTEFSNTDVDNATTGNNERLGEYTGYTSLPVELISFNAMANGNSVELAWNTATEVNNAGFEIEKLQNSTWNKIGYVEGAGTSNVPHSYSFTDAAASGVSQYRLKQIDRDGGFTYSSVVEAVNTNGPSSFSLGQNYPNPFNPTTQIRYSLASDAQVSLKVYDILGHEVETLVDGVQPAGEQRVTFNASRLSSGIYFYTLRAGNFTAMKKLLLLK